MVPPELNFAVSRLAEARAHVEKLILERDQIIVRAIRMGTSKKELAEATDLAPVSIYKILTRWKERETSCP